MCYADDLLVLCTSDDIFNKVDLCIRNWGDLNKVNFNYKPDKTRFISIKDTNRR